MSGQWTVLRQATFKALALIWLLSLLVSLANLAIPFYTLQIFDRVLPSKSKETLIMLLVAISIFGLLLIGCEILRRKVAACLASFIEKTTEPYLLDKQLSNIHQSTEQRQSTLHQLKTLRTFATSPTLFAVMDTTLIPILIIAIFALHSLFGYVLIVANIMFFLVIIFQHYSLRKTQDIYQKSSQAQQRKNQSFAVNMPAFRAMGMADAWFDKTREISEQAQQMQCRHEKTNHTFQSINLSIRWLFQIIVPTLGAYLLITNQISAGVMLAALMLSMRGVMPFDTLVNSWQLVSNTWLIVVQLKATDVLSHNEKTIQPPEQITGKIWIKGLRLKDPSSKSSLLSLHEFEAMPASFNVIIGPNGSGKTLLLESILGNVAIDKGKIFIDEINTSLVDRQWLGKQLGYVPQRLHLPNASIKDIICHHEECNESKLIHAAKTVAVHQTISSLPEGYETLVNMTSSGLSLGILQRICLARALYHQPRLLIFDEADAYLDEAGKKAYLSLIMSAKAAGCTVIAVTQNTKILSIADKVLLIDKGEVEYSGNVSSLQAFVQQNTSQRVRPLFS